VGLGGGKKLEEKNYYKDMGGNSIPTKNGADKSQMHYDQSKHLKMEI